MSDIVKLRSGTVDLTGWDAVTINRSIDTCADTFSLSSEFDVTNQSLMAALKPFGYQRATVKIDNDLLITGRIESVDCQSGSDGRTISAQGRSLTGSLIDCAIDIGKYNFNGLKLSAIATQICQPFGISVDAQYDKKIDEAMAEPGQTAFDFLNKLAQGIGCILTCDTAGKLVIRKFNATTAPVDSLVEGRGKVYSISASYNGSERYSQYKLLQQQDGKTNLKATASDSGVPIYRPMVSTGSDGNATEIEDAVKWRRALALAGSVQVSVSVDGWRDQSGALYNPGSVVSLNAPGCFIKKDTLFLIRSVTNRLTAGDMSTDLSLILPATYTGQMPGAYPWD